MSVEDAEEYTQSLGQILGGSWRQVALAERMGVHEALGLTIQEWVQQRLGGYTRLSVSERREAVRELTAPPDDGGHGMSQQEAAGVLGVNQGTVSRDLRPESYANAYPEPEPESPDLDESSESYANAYPGPEPEFGADIGFDFDAEGEPEPDPEPEPEAEPTKPPPAHVAQASGDQEWFTPPEFIEAARRVLDGIDLDPASAPEANAVIRAETYYTATDDGLSQPWKGRVWLNPPYASKLVGAFTGRLTSCYEGGDVTEACVLVNNATETGWFQDLAARAEAICFPRGRLTFWYPGKRTVTPLQGQAIVYLGPHSETFAAEFEQFGTVVIRWD